MSIISEYYQNYAGTDYLKDLSPFIFDAIHYIMDESYAFQRKLYDHTKKNTRSKSPAPSAPDFSLMPGAELGFEPIHTRFFSGVSGAVGDVDLHFAEDMRDARGSDCITEPEIKALLAKGLSPEIPKRVPVRLAVIANERHNPSYNDAVRTSIGCGQHNGIPILCNLALGEIYYVFGHYLDVRKSQGLPLLLYLPFTEKSKAKYFWRHSPVMSINWITGKTHLLGCPLTEKTPAKGKYADRHVFWAMPWQDHNERFSLGDVTVASAEELAPKTSAGTPNPPRQRYALSPATGTYTLGFLEKLHALEPGSLTETAFFDRNDPKHACHIEMCQFQCLANYFGNLFQGVLQTATQSDWFLRNLLCTMRPGGKPMAGRYKSVAAWLGLNTPDCQHFLSRPDEQEMMFFMIVNSLKPTSKHEFLRIWQQVLEANSTWLDEYTPDRSNPRVTDGQVKVLGQNGRFLFRSNRLPYFMYKYTEHRLHKRIPVYKYLKYIITEGKATFDPTRKTSATLKDLEGWLYDYNRMAKEIIPNFTFALPYHLKSAHDNMVENYNRIKADRLAADESGGCAEDDELIAFASCYLDRSPAVLEDEKYCVCAPASSMDLYEEGITLNHCVTSYGQDIMAARGSMLIFFLREKTRKKHPLITMQVDRHGDEYQLTEIAGKGNRVATAEETAFAYKWLPEFNRAFKAAKAATRAKPISYRIDVIEWLKLLGVDEGFVPTFHAEQPLEDNYAALFVNTIPVMLARAAAEESLSPSLLTSIKAQLAKFCNSLRLKSATSKSILLLVKAGSTAA